MKSEAGSGKSEGLDLKARTLEFGVRCVRLAEALPASRSGNTIAAQLVRCGTSVGANYRAARRARSKAEFAAKLGIVEEECDETIYWMEVIQALALIKPELLVPLHQEADEILAITVTAIKTTKSNQASK